MPYQPTTLTNKTKNMNASTYFRTPNAARFVNVRRRSFTTATAAPLLAVTDKELKAIMDNVSFYLGRNLGQTEAVRDALQSALLNIYAKPQTWNPERMTLEKYLYNCAKREYIKATAKKVNQTATFSSLAVGDEGDRTEFETAGSIATAARTFEERELFAAYVRPVLRTMRPEKARTILKIMVLERWGLKTVEMAEALNMNDNTLRVTQKRFRETLQKSARLIKA